MQVKALRLMSRSALIVATLLWIEKLLTASDVLGSGDLESNLIIHLAAAYAFTILAFAACPATRRGDLAKLSFASGALLCLMRAAIWHQNLTVAVACEAIGATAAVLPSAMERMRVALRADPEARLSIRRRSERRVTRCYKREPVFSRGESVGFEAADASHSDGLPSAA